MALNKDRVREILAEKAVQFDDEVKSRLTGSSDFLKFTIRKGVLVELRSLTKAIEQYPNAQREDIVKVIKMRIKQLE